MKRNLPGRLWTGLATGLLCLSFMLPLQAFAGDEPAGGVSVSLMSQYIWRGQELSRDSLVVQPSVTVSYEGFAASIWQNIDTDYWNTAGVGADSLNETDTTLSYSMDLGTCEIDAGYIWYSLDGADDSQEIYGTMTLDLFLSPTLTVYREFSHYPSTYITLGISHSMELPRNIGLELSLQGSYLISSDKEAYPDPGDPGDEYSDLHDGLATVTLNVPVTKRLTLSPELEWSFPLSSTAADDMQARNAGHGGKDNFLYGGITASLAF